MERQPQKIPLPCYGQEHDRFDPTCQQCRYAEGCLVYMGSRAGKVPLDRITFDIVPEKFRADVLDVDDPELPHLQRLYTDCFHSVFHRNPTDNISRFTKEVAVNARKARCSVRMFMLANMVAHTVHEDAVIKNSDKGRAATFRAKLLTGDFSIKRAKTYQEMCHNQFGTFSLSSLAVLADSEDADDLDATMLRSEITAAQWLVRYRIFHSGPAEPLLYESEELQLAPEWLAIEESYINLILKPFVNHTIKGSDAVERHRFSVVQTHGFYKRHLTNQRLAWLARQSIMPQAVQAILSTFNLRPDDLLYSSVPVNDPMTFWRSLASTIRHYHCWLFLNGEPSYFTPRRNETLQRRS